MSKQFRKIRTRVQFIVLRVFFGGNPVIYHCRFHNPIDIRSFGTSGGYVYGCEVDGKGVHTIQIGRAQAAGPA